MTEILGIHQSDLTLMTMVREGLRRLRSEDSWCLDFVFASLAQDDLTKQDYGQKEIDQAKKWFLSTNIPVVIDQRFDSATFPCISIALAEAGEAEKTLADVNYETHEDSLDKPPQLMDIESVQWSENFVLGVHTTGEPTHTLYLYSILLFIMLRYKEALLEQRGFERVSLRATAFNRNPVTQNELLFSRYIMVTGFTRQCWPKFKGGKVTDVAGILRPVGSGHLPTEDKDNNGWIGQLDSLDSLGRVK